MKKYLVTFTLLLLCAPSFGKIRPEVQAAHKAYHEIGQETINDTSDCSATAIGPQALLTASHCEMASDTIQVSGVEESVQIKERIRDGLDHTIYLIDGATFTDISEIDQNNVNISEEVFIIGNPGPFSDFFRHGYLVGVKEPAVTLSSLLNGDRGAPELYFDMNIYHGDSGSAVFNSEGKIVAVLSEMRSYTEGNEKRAISFAMAYPLHFTPEQLDKAKNFKTEKKNSDGQSDSAGQPAPTSK